MIAPNNPRVDVNELMSRVRAEAAAMRARDSGGDSLPSNAPFAETMVSDGVVDLSRHVIIGSLIEDAARMSRPRTALPKRLERMPYRIASPMFSLALRVLKYAFKDQSHVNASTQQALRELLRFATTIGGHVAQMASLARDQRNIARDMASIAARLEAAEQRAAELQERNHVVEARALALERAITVNAARIDALEGASTNTQLRLERLEGAEARSALVTASISDTRRELATERERALRAEASLRSELTAGRHLSASMPQVASTMSADPAVVVPAQAYADVHLAIADKFRGDSADIVEQLESYIAVVRSAATVDAERPLVDIGSGRGEFLELCRAAALPAYGVELDAFLAERAQMDGLDVRQNDGVSALRAAATSGLGAVTAFHVIEHLAFDELLAFFDEALRALAPGGVLVCETPNPANVTIGACNFYLDPTHRHPLPAPLIAFLLELRGFTDVRIVELQPNYAMQLDEDSEAARRINGFFYGAQNYAAIARKPGASN